MTGRIRSLLIIVVSAALLVGGFFIYERLQPKHATKESPAVRANKRATTSPGERLNNIGAGEDPWLKRYDNLGRLASQFKATRYDPQKDGTVNVTEPEAEFFLRGGTQRMRVHGVSGIVVMQTPEAGEKQPLKTKGQAQPPNRGRLQEVTIDLFDPAEATTPSMTVKMNNASFDNATFRIATDAFNDASGNRIEPDQVPVTLRGKDYDFDGRGLVIRWNELDQKLQLLEIAHGEKLIVKNPKSFVPTTGPVLRADFAEKEMLASIDPLAAAQVVKKKPAKKKPTPPAHPVTRPHRPPQPPTLYRATFFDNVKITQADEENVSAEKMDVDFLVESQELTEAPAPTPAPALAENRAATNKKPPKSTTAPTTRPEDQPMIVTWTGKLRVVPLDGPIDPSLTPGKAIVSFFGSPVKLTRKGAEAICAIARYNTAASSASLVGSDAVPVVTMKDSRGATITSHSLQYTESGPGEKIAVLDGASSARVPTGEPNDPHPQILAADWQKSCTLHLVDDEQGKTNITDAKLVGDVKVDDPQLSLNADSLNLSFTPSTSTQPAAPSTQPIDRLGAAQLRNMLAEGNVHCVLKEAPDKTRTVDSQKLAVETAKSPEGKIYPRLVNADGDVHAVDADRDLSAGHLTATLRPSTRPSTASTATTQKTADVELEKLTASDNVKVTDHKDGSFAAAAAMEVLVVDGQQRVKLIGQPLATVSSDDNKISGSEIQFLPDEQLARIPGNGTLRAKQAGATTRMVDVAWAGGAVVNGKTNLVDIDQQVNAKSVDHDGTLNQIDSQHLQLTLVEVPTTKPATTKPDDDISKQAAFLQNKQVKTGSFTGKVHITSELTDGAGAIVRGVNLYSETINFDKLAGTVEVPVPGTMLFEDHRPKSAPAEKNDPNSGTLSGGRGETAFKWQKSFSYEDGPMRATMLGDVAIVHKPEEKGGDPFRLDAEKVIAELEKKPKDEKAPPTTQPTADARLKKFTASGNVRVVSTRASFECEDLEYDPQSGMMIARGSKDNPGSVTNESHPQKVAFKELRWNTTTDQIKVTDFRGRSLP